MTGTFSSYAFLFMHKVRTHRGNATMATWVLCLYLLCSVVGRLGVAPLGLTFNIEEYSDYTPPIWRPKWKNGTVNSENMDSAWGSMGYDSTGQ